MTEIVDKHWRLVADPGRTKGLPADWQRHAFDPQGPSGIVCGHPPRWSGSGIVTTEGDFAAFYRVYKDYLQVVRRYRHSLVIPKALTPKGGETEGATIEAFVQRVYALAAEGDEFDSIDMVYAFIDDAFLKGEFPLVDEVFRIAQPDRLLPSIVVSMLMASVGAKAKLHNRLGFIARAAEVIRKKWGDAEADELFYYK